jgi:hypothetical protein
MAAALISIAGFAVVACGAVIYLRGRASQAGSLVVRTSPTGASIAVDGSFAGPSPLTRIVGAGEHEVALVDERYLTTAYRVSVSPRGMVAISAELWRRSPLVQLLHPSSPGATIATADFLDDGRVALVEDLPDHDQQLWLLDASGVMRQVGASVDADRITLSRSGSRIAFVAKSTASPPGAPRQMSIDAASAAGTEIDRSWNLALASGEQVADLAWAPDGRHVLVIARRQDADGIRSRFLWLDTEDGAAPELSGMPTDVVPNSYSWSPNGNQVAFLARTGSLTSLCVLDVDSPGTLIYLADVGRDDAGPLPFPPVAWSPDGGQLLYAAPTDSTAGPTGWLFGAKPLPALFQASLVHPFGERLGRSEGQAPVWRGNGTVLVVVPGHGNSLDIRELVPDGDTAVVGTIPVAIKGAFAVRWDPRHARAILVARGATPGESASLRFWLLDFGAEATR